MTAVAREQRHTRARRCPVCDGADGDVRGRDRRCHGFSSTDGDWVHCSREDHAGAIVQNDAGLFTHRMRGSCKCGTTHGAELRAREEIEAVYPYADEHGEVLYEVVRKGNKRFFQRRPDGAGDWLYQLGNTRRVLYKLPELLADDADRTVFVVEGEKDVDTLRAGGFLATCNPQGAGKWHTVADLAREVLRDRNIIIIADADKEGRDHGRDVEASLRGVARSLEVFECPAPHKDATDLLRAGGRLENLIPMDRSGPPAPASEAAPTAKRLPRPPSPTGPRPPTDESRPQIRVGVDLDRMLDEATTAIATHPDVYQRGNDLVHVLRGEATEALADPGAPTTRPIPQALLRTMLCSVARFEEWKAGAPRPVVPPDDTVKALHARGSWSGVRPLVGVIEAPAMRADGSVLQDASYDARTGFLYEPREDFGRVPEQPTQDDARRAYAELEEVFAEFPFTNEAARVLPIAALLTMLARGAIRGSVPCFVFDANTRGSGKTLVTDAVTMIASGRASSKMAWPPDDVELEKVLGACALRGGTVLNFDNITRPFGGAPLDRCLTAVDRVELRVLGKSETPSLPWLAVVFGSGNNVALCADTARRTLLSRLESLEENPEDRTNFKHHPLLPWVAQERPRLVRAALTILRAWHVAGRPLGERRTWGSFEAWAALIPPALAFAGAPDPMRCRAEAVGVEDVGKSALAAILDFWPRLDEAGRGLTLREALATLYPAQRAEGPPDGFEGLRDALETLAPPKVGRSPDPRALGEALRQHRDRVLGGRRLENASTRGNRQTWTVRKVITE